ncbi:ABC transporter ATP-binding protein, partial [Bacillus atrophaeus]
AFVGPTGAGKTTVTNLLARFYEPGEGAILIDGIDIKDMTRSSLRKHMGFVLQDSFLFQGTIRENIRYGRLDATDHEVEEAAKNANAHSFIERLPKGYDTVLTQNGAGISQGQKQLISIARAVLADPVLLILDEATSNIDTVTEVKIQQALARLMEGRTSVMIAHRLNTIQRADQIVVLKDGEMIERGSHAELLRQKGFYSNLYESQFKRA